MTRTLVGTPDPDDANARFLTALDDLRAAGERLAGQEPTSLTVNIHIHAERVDRDVARMVVDALRRAAGG